MDPPYNTESSAKEGNRVADHNEFVEAKKFIYRDKFSRNGWLNMLKDRLELAHELLNEEGIIFVSIDDNEHAYLKILMDEIFGEENFISNLFFIKKPSGSNDKKHIAETTEFILFYAKNKNAFEVNLLKKPIDILDWKYNAKYNRYEKDGSQLEKGGDESFLTDRPNLGYVVYYNEKTEKAVIRHDYDKENLNENSTQEIYSFNQELIDKGFVPIIARLYRGKLGRWKVADKKLQELIENELIKFKKTNNGWKIYKKDFVLAQEEPHKLVKPRDMISFTSNSKGTILLRSIFPNNAKSVFSNPKPVDLISYLINLHTKNNAKVLDFYAGSGTTGHAVLDLNKKDGGSRTYTLVTNNENKIGTNVTHERLYRINYGTDSKKKRKIDWAEENNPYKSNLNVYQIKYKNMAINKKEDLDKLLNDVKQMLIDFNIPTDTIDITKILSKLRSLRALENDKDLDSK
ncbi:site-specific DNA-methyltransferase [Mycoplasma sp. 1578d]|nr:site-specific DNA-methyltransferase [Mycoplasma sp. 1578d]